jgi:hypothetical protein
MTFVRIARAMPWALALAISVKFYAGSALAEPWEEGIVLSEEDPAGLGESVLMPGNGSTGTLSEQTAPFDSEMLQQSISATPISPAADDVSSATIEDGPSLCMTGMCPPAQPCVPDVLHQPGLVQCLAAHKNACWTFRSDAILLWRNAPSERPIYSTIDPGTGGIGPTALDANNLNSDVLVAPRLSLLRTDGDGRTIEATYIYAGNFYSDRTLAYARDGYVTSPPGIYGNTWGPQGTELNTATAKLLGQLQSLEFNARHCLWADTCQFLIGPRWLQWNETLQMQDSFSSPPPPAPTTLEGSDFYQTQCFNNLWGGQIGLDALLLGRVGQARVEGLVKAGAYYNAAGQTSAYTYTTEPPFTFSGSNRNTGPASAAFVGEVGMTAVIPICCNWDFRCGYFGLWLTGLAQPTNQLSDQTITQIEAPSGTLDTNGRLILQGLSLGLEGRW